MQSSQDKAAAIQKEIADLEAKRQELESQRKNIKDTVDKAREDTKKALDDFNRTKALAEKANEEVKKSADEIANNIDMKKMIDIDRAGLNTKRRKTLTRAKKRSPSLLSRQDPKPLQTKKIMRGKKANVLNLIKLGKRPTPRRMRQHKSSKTEIT